MKRICTIALGLGVLGLATSANAVTVDFEGNTQGQTVEFAGFGNGIFAVSAAGNSGDASGPTVLDTEKTNDPNFKYKFSGGNLKNSRLRKVLIVPTTDGSASPTADPAGGELTLTFFNPLKSFGFDAVDVDVADAPNTFVTFRLNGSDVATIPFSEFKNSNSPFKRPTVAWGNRTANRIAPITSAQLGSDFDEVVFDFPSEMAIDNISYRVSVPEPTAVGMLLGLPALTMLRRRRRA